MPHKNHDLHGNAPDACDIAVLLIDVINDLEFPGGARMLPTALRAGRRMHALKQDAARLKVPVIYANDNFGRWRSNFDDVLAHVLNDGVRGEPIGRLLAPAADDYFVLKPKHSAFFATTLERLLAYLKTKRLVLCGFAGEACVLMTAVDAYLRDIEVFVPSDCSASISAAHNREALRYMARVLHADTRVSSKLDLKSMRGRRGRSAKT